MEVLVLLGLLFLLEELALPAFLMTLAILMVKGGQDLVIENIYDSLGRALVLSLSIASYLQRER